jgi:hypothetical protein
MSLGKLAFFCVMASLVGCATHAVRCDAHLQAINAPRPKPSGKAAPGTDPAPRTPTATSVP